MDRRFDSAVEWVERVSAPLIKNGHIDFGELHPMEAILRLNLGIYWIPDDDNGMASQTSGYMFSHEGATRWLLDNVEKVPGSFSLMKMLCLDRLNRNLDLDSSMRLFLQLHLSELIPPPKGRRADRTIFGNIWLHTWVKTAGNDYNLKLTRNDETKSARSACDAVSKGLERNGHHRSYRALKEICVGKSHAPARIWSEHWVAAWHHARSAGIIPPHALDRYWYGV